jgi:hypothetical protein
VRITLLCIALLGLSACSRDIATAEDGDEAAVAGGCLAAGDGRMEASLRGALEARIDWSNAQMSCDGDLRPDGQVLRVTMVGPLETERPEAVGAARPEAVGAARPEAVGATRQLRFILGIDLVDTADGPAQVLPTNLTVIVEGESLLYATRGSDRCAVEDFMRTPLADGLERVSGRGYCLGPASDLAGETRVLVPTFSFTALARTGAQAPAPPAP